uniref:hypothetical protein n=1 Tax=Stappia sp. TaxID=1870903 RepID=UPI003BAB9A35
MHEISELKQDAEASIRDVMHFTKKESNDEIKADRALNSFAVAIRTLDDLNVFAHGLRNQRYKTSATVYKDGQAPTKTDMRQLLNKIIHARHFKWELDQEPPSIICSAMDSEDWKMMVFEVRDLEKFVRDHLAQVAVDAT